MISQKKLSKVIAHELSIYGRAKLPNTKRCRMLAKQMHLHVRRVNSEIMIVR